MPPASITIEPYTKEIIMSTQKFNITGMSCGHCEHAVTEEVSQLPGISNIRVSAQAGTLELDSDGTADDAAIIAAVDEAGYSAVRA